MIKKLLFFILIISSQSYAQDFEGRITFSITYESPDSSRTVPTSFRDQKITEYISEDRIRTEQGSTIGDQITVYRAKDSTYFVLLKVAGDSLAITMSKEFAVSSDKEKPVIKYKWKRKTIAGLKCRLAIVTYPDQDPIKVYYSKEISPTINQKFEGLKGYPILFYFHVDGIIEHHRAILIEESEIDDSLFVIPEGYRKMTLEEFQRGL